MISGKISPYFKDKNKANKFGRKTGMLFPYLLQIYRKLAAILSVHLSLICNPITLKLFL